MSSEKKVRMIDLRNDVEYQSLLDGRPETSGLRAGRVYLQAGESCGQHNTERNEEVLVFLSGRGLAVIGNNCCYEVGEGKVSYIPPDTVHDIKNTGNQPLIYVYCVAPVHHKQSAHESKKPRPNSVER